MKPLVHATSEDSSKTSVAPTKAKGNLEAAAAGVDQPNIITSFTSLDKCNTVSLIPQRVCRCAV